MWFDKLVLHINDQQGTLLRHDVKFSASFLIGSFGQVEYLLFRVSTLCHVNILLNLVNRDECLMIEIGGRSQSEFVSYSFRLLLNKVLLNSVEPLIDEGIE